MDADVVSKACRFPRAFSIEAAGRFSHCRGNLRTRGFSRTCVNAWRVQVPPTGPMGRVDAERMTSPRAQECDNVTARNIETRARRAKSLDDLSSRASDRTSSSVGKVIPPPEERKRLAFGEIPCHPARVSRTRILGFPMTRLGVISPSAFRRLFAGAIVRAMFARGGRNRAIGVNLRTAICISDAICG